MAYSNGDVEAVHDAGRIVLELLEVDIPPVGFYCETTEGGSPILRKDGRYWSTWERIQEIVQPFGGFSTTLREKDTDETPHMNALAVREVDGQEFRINISYVANGTLVITLEFRLDEMWITPIDDRVEELSPLDVGRQVAAFELAVLAHELESPTESLDYWMTTEHPYRQSTWAKVRKASRQTVNDRIRSAQEKLGQTS